jgi:DNA polymerase I-like protein with 3'-5' exonuclease and polymerase domains
VAKKKSRSSSGEDSLNGCLFPPSGDWEPPVLPDHSVFRDAKRISVDCETRDPNLKTMGPGTFRGDVELTGVSIAVEDKSWYLPIGHLAGGNLDRDHVLEWLSDLTRTVETTWVGTNLPYDLEILRLHNVIPRGKFFDVGLVEACIDEESETGYSLEAMSRKYIGIGKDETLLREAADAYGIDPKKELWKLHSKYVGAYAEVDAINPLKIMDRQLRIIHDEELERTVDVEMRIIPMLLDMRFLGIPVDLEFSEKLGRECQEEEDRLRLELLKLTHLDVDVWSGQSLATMCNRLKIPFNRTSKGNPSFDDEFLRFAEHPAMDLVVKIRTINRLGSTFVRDFDKKWVGKDGRVHCQFHQLKTDEDGTRSGRFSCSNPNLQQTPGSRMELRAGEWGISWAKKVRRRFRPDEGLLWNKMDYSQQEPRTLVHFACLLKLMGSGEFRDTYRNDRTTDIYKLMVDMAKISRRMAKDLSLGRMYGMGKKKLAEKLNCDQTEANEHLRNFDKHFPFVKELADACMQKASNRGYVRTLLGRRCRFNLWEPADSWDRKKNGESIIPCRLDVATNRWPGSRLVRSMVHKALNRLIQGSAADITKLGMLQLYEEHGVVPYLTMHDEVGTGVENEEQAKQQTRVLETCVDLQVPLYVESFVGDSWGVKL